MQYVIYFVTHVIGFCLALAKSVVSNKFLPVAFEYVVCVFLSLPLLLCLLVIGLFTGETTPRIPGIRGWGVSSMGRISGTEYGRKFTCYYICVAYSMYYFACYVTMLQYLKLF